MLRFEEDNSSNVLSNSLQNKLLLKVENIPEASASKVV